LLKANNFNSIFLWVVTELQLLMLKQNLCICLFCLHREVQQFRPEVRNSPEVRFAVQAFAALNSNNFVRFFKLVQAASYLNACLLHCYFNQVRKRQMDVF